MSTSKQLWFLQRADARFSSVIMPLIAASIMLCSSFLPWLKDPIGTTYSAWSLPVDLGWQIRAGTFNYGTLCLCCAAYACLIAYASWKPFRGSSYFKQKYVAAGLFCLVPLFLFLLQYLCIDVREIDVLAQHKTQAILISNHFGYSSIRDLLSVRPFYLDLDISTISGRLTLLVDQVAAGLALPLISAWLLIDYKRLFAIPPRHSSSSKSKRLRFLLVIAGFIAVLLLLRGPAGLICEYEGKASLSSGNYAQALTWLDRARLLNPALNEVAYYHRERGQALYYLYPDQVIDDSSIYLAFAYRIQGDYLDAYQQLLGTWQVERTTPWIISEMSITLEGQIEFTHPLRGPLIRRPLNDDTTLPWLQSLIQVDASNVYGHFLAGRVNYDLHNYTQCLVQMAAVLHLSTNSDIQSSAYTYMGLSEIGLGNDTEGRELLFMALKLDSDYRNNVAREELSGLR